MIEENINEQKFVDNMNEREKMQEELNLKKSAKKTKKQEKTVEKPQDFDKSMENIQATPIVENNTLYSVEEESKVPNEEKTQETIEKNTNNIKDPKPEKKVSIVSPDEAKQIEEKGSSNKIAKLEDEVDLALTSYNDIMQDHRESREIYNSEEEIDIDVVDEDDNDVKIEIVEGSNINLSNKDKKSKKKHQPRKNYYGGNNGEEMSFKLRTSKVSKILRNMDIKDPNAIKAVSASDKTANIETLYSRTVLPTLRPSYSVVPMITSGIVITMTAFTWADILEMSKLEEKIANLDPGNEDYIYESNIAFIEKRRDQLALFYSHIHAVSGYKEVPSPEVLFGKLIKLPDMQQLFFAALTATYQKPKPLTLTCGVCGFDNEYKLLPKNMCFLLNQHIDYKRLCHYIEKGSLGSENTETKTAYEEFKKERIVETCNSIYRISNTLPVSSFIYDLKVPTIYEALDAMEEMASIFRNKPFVIRQDGAEFNIDCTYSSPYYPRELYEYRKYLYVNKLLVPQIIQEDNDNNSVKVSYIEFDNKNQILNSIAQLSSEDYVALLNDNQLNNVIRLKGIVHQLAPGKCGSEVCQSDMGRLVADPEILFFLIARQEETSISRN